MGKQIKLCLTLVVVFGVILTQVSQELRLNTIQEKVSDIQKKADSLVLQQCAYHDTLEALRQHYRTCMFLSKESLVITHDGYLKLKK